MHPEEMQSLWEDRLVFVDRPRYTTTVEFKDPDFAWRLPLSDKARKAIMGKAAGSENYCFEIDFDEEGMPVDVRQVDISR